MLRIMALISDSAIGSGVFRCRNLRKQKADGFMQSVQESEWKADCSCQNSHIK